MDKLPISVIVTLQSHRLNFFKNWVYPTIRINNPLEILIDDSDTTHVSTKRNEMAKKAKGEFIFICEDDIQLPACYLEILYNKIKDTNHSIAYTGYQAIVWHPDFNPIGHNYGIESQEFNPETLKENNYISTISLYRKKDWVDFDDTLDKLEDWDVFLTMADQGKTGIHVPETYFMAHFIDKGRSTTPNEKKIKKMIQKKHGIKIKQ